MKLTIIFGLILAITIAYGFTPIHNVKSFANTNSDSVLACPEHGEVRRSIFINLNKVSSNTTSLLLESLHARNITSRTDSLTCLKSLIVTADFGQLCKIETASYPHLKDISLEMERIESISEGTFTESLEGISIWAPELVKLPVDLASKKNLQWLYIETKAPFTLDNIKASWKVMTKLSINLDLNSVNQNQIFELNKLEYLELFNVRLELDFVLKLIDIKSLKNLVLYANLTDNEKQTIKSKLPFEVEFKSFTK